MVEEITRLFTDLTLLAEMLHQDRRSETSLQSEPVEDERDQRRHNEWHVNPRKSSAHLNSLGVRLASDVLKFLSAAKRNSFGVVTPLKNSSKCHSILLRMIMTQFASLP
jgi:hypothetical protein